MTSADQGLAAGLPRREFAVGTLVARARQLARQRAVLIVAAVLVVGGGGAAIVAVAKNASNSIPAWVGSDCGASVSGQGFQVFACMSGGARAGHPHPKELLVFRSNGSSVSYPAFRVGEFAVGAGEVVATYNVNLVRVTSSRLVPLLTSGQLARALHVQTTAIMDIYNPTLDEHGDIYFFASVLSPSRHGCRSPLIERAAGGTVRQMRASTTPNNICS